jgi:hypothetical protein
MPTVLNTGGYRFFFYSLGVLSRLTSMSSTAVQRPSSGLGQFNSRHLVDFDLTI